MAMGLLDLVAPDSGTSATLCHSNTPWLVFGNSYPCLFELDDCTISRSWFFSHGIVDID